MIQFIFTIHFIQRFVMKILILLFLSFFELFANKIQPINTYEATFHQIIINNSNKEIQYSGKIYIKQPRQILWQYKDPIEKFVYINDTTVTIIEPELEQAIVSVLKEEINLLKLIKDAKSIDNTHYVSSLYGVDYHLTIIKDQLTAITYTDEIDNKITINFTNINQNQPIAKKVFRLRIPSYFDIIRK